jgi:4-hydroxy-2-oxoheptanedioate aldolase
MNSVRRAIAEGRPSFGFSLSFPSPEAAELVGRSAFDWAFLDLQHGGITWDTLRPVMQALELGGTESLVRVQWNDEASIMRALDLGAIGVIVPMVSTGEEAHRAASATRYPPQGARSYGPLRRGRAPQDANSDVLCLVMVETVEGLANLEEITSIPGVDGIFLGPTDLGLSIGGNPDPGPGVAMSPSVLAAIDDVVDACRTCALIPGTVSIGAENALDLLKRGIRLMTVGHDLRYLRMGLEGDVQHVAQWTSEFVRHDE